MKGDAEAITDAVGRHFKEQVAGIKAAYSTDSSGTANVEPMPDSIYDTPVVVVAWNRYELVRAGSWEVIRDYITADIYFDAQAADAAYKTLVPFVTLVRRSFRNNATLYESCDVARAVSGGPHEPVTIAGANFMRLPFEIEATTQGPATYRHVPV